jgi:hypothetical protein
MGVTYAVHYLEVSLYAGVRPIMQRYVMEVLHHPPPQPSLMVEGDVPSATSLVVKKSNLVLAIYAPMIYTVPCVMFLMRADPLRGQVGGHWALKNKSFFWTCEMALKVDGNEK